MNTLYLAFQFMVKHLLVQTAQRYINSNKIRISSSNNIKVGLLSLAYLAEYISGHEKYYQEQAIYND